MGAVEIYRTLWSSSPSQYAPPKARRTDTSGHPKRVTSRAFVAHGALAARSPAKNDTHPQGTATITTT